MIVAHDVTNVWSAEKASTEKGSNDETAARDWRAARVGKGRRLRQKISDIKQRTHGTTSRRRGCRWKSRVLSLSRYIYIYIYIYIYLRPSGLRPETLSQSSLPDFAREPTSVTDRIVLDACSKRVCSLDTSESSLFVILDDSALSALLNSSLILYEIV